MRIADRYVLERPLGEGGMAGVFLARDEQTGAAVAVKQLHAELGDHTEVRARFMREARIVARLTHPHIVAIHDVQPVEESGGIALVMAYVEGTDLSGVLRGNPPLVLCPELAAAVLRPVAEALAYVHREGIIHRDVKPANVLLGRDGAIKLTDFGIARGDDDQGLTRTGDFLGTPAYIPPEQARGVRVTAAADQYALGVMLYQLVTGEKPFAARSTAEIVLAILRSEYPDPRSRNAAVDDALADVINRAMAPDPDARFPDVEAFIDALDACVPPIDAAATAEIVTALVADPAAGAAAFARRVADSLCTEGEVARDLGDLRTATEKARAAAARCARHAGAHRLLAALGEAPPDPTAVGDGVAVSGEDRTVFDPRGPSLGGERTEVTPVARPAGAGLSHADTDPPVAAPAPSPPPPARRPVGGASATDATVLRPAPPERGGVAGWKVLLVVFVFTALIGGGIAWLVHRDPPPPPAMPSP